jgi:hypothetical protein
MFSKTLEISVSLQWKRPRLRQVTPKCSETFTRLHSTTTSTLWLHYILLLFLVIFHKPAVTNTSTHYECRRHSQVGIISGEQRRKIHRDRCLKFPVALQLNKNCSVLWTCTSFTVLIASNLFTPTYNITTRSHVANTHLGTNYRYKGCQHHTIIFTSLQRYSGYGFIMSNRNACS